MNVSSARTVVLVAGLFALAIGGFESKGRGFSGLGADPGGFAQVVRGKPLMFPADHGAHPDYRIEWWYFTANLLDAHGTSYGSQWTLFRQALSSQGLAPG